MMGLSETEGSCVDVFSLLLFFSCLFYFVIIHTYLHRANFVHCSIIFLSFR